MLSEVLGFGFKEFRNNWKILLLLGFLNSFLSFFIVFTEKTVVVLSIIILQSFIYYKLYELSYMIVFKGKPVMSNLFSSDKFTPFFITFIIYILIIIFGTILFIIPGIILSIMYQFSVYIIFYKDMSLKERFVLSKNITYGQRWQLFKILTIMALILWVGSIISCVLLPVSFLVDAYIFKKLINGEKLKLIGKV